MASYYQGAALTAQQVAQVFYQAGWRGDALAQITGIVSQRESRIPDGQPNAGMASSGAHRTSTNNNSAASGDLGLAQINWGAWGDQLKAAGIIRTHTDLYDPVTNAKAAKFVFDKQGWAAWGSGAGGWQTGGSSTYGVNMRTAQAAVASAQSQGLIGTDWNTGNAAAVAGGGGSSALPRDARLVRFNGQTYAMFQIGPNVWIRYGASAAQTGGRPVANMTAAQFRQSFGDSVAGGNVSELEEVQAGFGSYAGYVKQIMDQMFTAGDPRRNDPEILRVLATRAGRPDMTEAEFQNLLKDTDYHQTRTEGQLRWNDLSEAERDAQRRDMEARMTQTVLSMVGAQPSREAGTGGGWIHNNTIKAHLEAVASGAMGFGEWTEQVLKPFAAKMPESPWSRQLRTEQESQRERPIDIENTVAQLRETSDRWGIKWDERTLRNRALGLVEKRLSDDDIVQELDTAAMNLYRGKPAGMETVVWASPWIETYNRVLERQGSLKTAEIAKALSGFGRDPDNHDPWSFEQQLKATDAYDGTKVGQNEAWEQTQELVGMLGF
jgi:hypothetical protein